MAGFMLVKRLLSPLRRMWLHFYKRLQTAHEKSSGIFILYEDVKTCNDEDVHVLWSILVNLHNNGRYADSMAATIPNPSNSA